jgi:hypothetical protein
MLYSITSSARASRSQHVDAERCHTHLSSGDKISIKNLVRDMAYKEPGAGCAQVHEINLDILGNVS